MIFCDTFRYLGNKKNINVTSNKYIVVNNTDIFQPKNSHINIITMLIGYITNLSQRCYTDKNRYKWLFVNTIIYEIITQFVFHKDI